MKKYFLPISFSLCIGILMAYFIIHQYESYDGIMVSGMASKLYYVQRGVYSNKENMENNMREFTSYIYNVLDNMYYTYIGVSMDKNNALKIQNYYKEKGYDTYIKEKMISNSEFIKILSEYDNILAKTDDKESIKVICNQVLSKYEEYENGKYKN
ncbi:MAG: hypothetical protein IKG27_02835 [Bacilli bacterium]|nr:hypothetical protein [Bacilli bacterium]